MKNTTSELKNTLEVITIRVDEAEEGISELEDKVKWKTKVEQIYKKRLKKYEDSLRELKYDMKCSNIRIIGIAEGEEKKQGIESLFEKIITENFLNLDRGKAM